MFCGRLISPFCLSLVDHRPLSQHLARLSASLGLLVLLLSAQDVAVDAWALELIPRGQLSYAGACQTIGMSAGNALGYPAVLALTGGAAGRALHVTLQALCGAAAAAHLLAAIASSLVAEEGSQDGASQHAPTLRELWRRLRTLGGTEATRALGGVCFWQRVGVISLDASAGVFYMHSVPGARQEHLAAFAVAQALIGVLASLVVARLIATRQTGTMGAMRIGLWLLLGCGVSTPLVLGGLASMPPTIACAALGLLAAFFAAGNKIWWTAQAAAFNSAVVHHGSGGMHALHLQLLNSLSNVGKLWPRPLAFALFDAVGFRASSALLAGAGVLAWPSMHRLLTCPALKEIDDK